MRTLVSAVTSLGFVALLSSPVAAAPMCAEVETAKAALNKEAAAPNRAQAASRSEDVQAPRSNDIQAPRSDDVQAPRGHEVQAPRGNDIQAPRSSQGRSNDVQAPRAQDHRKAETLVKEADAACRAGQAAVASRKAREAMTLLQP